jgi:hypothetical protein
MLRLIQESSTCPGSRPTLRVPRAIQLVHEIATKTLLHGEATGRAFIVMLSAIETMIATVHVLSSCQPELHDHGATLLRTSASTLLGRRAQVVTRTQAHIPEADKRMPELYGVKRTDLLHYPLFALSIIPSNCVPAQYARARPRLETIRVPVVPAALHCIVRPAMAMHDAAQDASIHPLFQAVDMLCFSSQFHFLVC